MASTAERVEAFRKNYDKLFKAAEEALRLADISDISSEISLDGSDAVDSLLQGLPAERIDWTPDVRRVVTSIPAAWVVRSYYDSINLNPDTYHQAIVKHEGEKIYRFGPDELIPALKKYADGLEPWIRDELAHPSTDEKNQKIVAGWRALGELIQALEYEYPSLYRNIQQEKREIHEKNGADALTKAMREGAFVIRKMTSVVNDSHHDAWGKFIEKPSQEICTEHYFVDGDKIKYSALPALIERIHEQCVSKPNRIVVFSDLNELTWVKKSELRSKITDAGGVLFAKDGKCFEDCITSSLDRLRSYDSDQGHAL